MTGDAAKPKAASTGPKTLDMVRAAIEANSDRKGTSVPAIKSYIIGHYPDVDPQRLKFRLKKAIEKGFESGLLCRPKSSEFTGPSLNGRFLLSKEHLAAEEKAKKAKVKAAEKKAVVKAAKGEVKAKVKKSVKTKAKAKASPKKAAKKAGATKAKDKLKQPKEKSAKTAKPPKTPKKAVKGVKSAKGKSPKGKGKK